MTRPTNLVTAAAGKTGGAVAALLRAEGWPVRAIVRKRDARSERLDRLGVETVVADRFWDAIGGLDAPSESSWRYRSEEATAGRETGPAIR